MTLRVTVVGAGIAGTAAALVARSLGADVTVVLGRPGATSLGHGVLDGSTELEADARGVLAALHIYSVADCVVAASTGITRCAAGRDAALLDLTGKKRVLVPSSPRPGWDGNYLARAWTHAETTFVAADFPILRRTGERTMADIAIANLFDDDAYLLAVAQTLRAARGDADAILLPPWLGATAPRAKALSEAVGVPCGEALGDVGGPAGLRFEAARARAFAKAGIDGLEGWVSKAQFEDERWHLALGDDTIETDRVVLAIGGIAGGGIRYCPPEATLATIAPQPRAPFELAMTAPVILGDTRPLVLPGSIFGTSPERLAWPFTDKPLLERIGIIVDPDLRAHDDGLFAAGDALPERPRQWLDALSSGALAGQVAAT